jgi:DNA-binding NarL/FixJ family response regulator
MRVVIAEDSVLLRDGLARLFASRDIDVVATVGDATALLQAVEQHQPDLLLADVRMPPDFTDEGLRAALQVRQQWPRVGVLVLSQYVEERYATKLLAGHTSRVGYLLKDRVADVDEFVDAATRIAGGGTVLDPEVVSQLLVRRTDPLERITPREHDVLALMAEGRSNAGIAASLVVSESAVAKHVNSIFTKLGLTPADNNDHRRVLAVLRFLGTG